MYGLKQNLELVYAPCEKGEYRIVAGERRWEALKYLVSKGYKEFELATSKLTTPQDDDEEQVEIIIAVSYTHLDVYKRQVRQTWRRLNPVGNSQAGMRFAGCRQTKTCLLYTSSYDVEVISQKGNEYYTSGSGVEVELEEQIKK